MKEDWTNRMRHQLDHHKMTPPSGLWEDIAGQMDAPSELTHAKHSAAGRRWYWAVAAAILALVGVFTLYPDDSNQPTPQAAVSPLPSGQAATPKIPSQQNVLPAAQEPAQAISPTSRLLAKAEPTDQRDDKRAGEKADDERLIELSSELKPTEEHAKERPAEEPHEERVTEKPHEERRPEKRAEERRPERRAEDRPSELWQHAVETDAARSPRPDKWSIGIKASGGLLAAGNSVRQERIDYYYDSPMADYGNTASQTTPGYYPSTISTKTDLVSNHHLPVRFGLSVQYQLGERVALLSGISYTRLYSEFSIPLHPNIHYDQKLHYLGIPVGIAWQLWQTSHFSIYLSGGAMAEKCIRTASEAGSTGRKPWQWSVSAAAGAEYTFTPQFGVYLEPSLGYYFNDGTPLEHYYKEHPLAPSIEFGLRLHLK